MQSHILLITPSAKSLVISDALLSELNLPSVRTSNRRGGLAALRRFEFSLVLLDDLIATTDPIAASSLFINAGATPILEINFERSGSACVIRQVRAALYRRAQDRAQAQTAAIASLRAELRGALSGLLLTSELALRAAPPEQQPRLHSVVELAADLRGRLHP